MQQQFADDVVFVGVAARDEVGAMNDFVADYDLGGFDHLADVDRDVWEAFGVPAQPAFAFIDDDGSFDVHLGLVGGEDDLRARVESLTASS